MKVEFIQDVAHEIRLFAIPIYPMGGFTCGIGRQRQDAENLPAGRNDGDARSRAQASNTNESDGCKVFYQGHYLDRLATSETRHYQGVTATKPVEMEE